ncbi:hypothetical protein J437_LFUL018036 [Ladona fulva]|uniref:Transposase Tc1-like domain-containing protein n=1 Tax=Ladona fulva TaxID=123851 RepID=A0A8K0PAH6_LADFU|nr:hypothetical protein J437_LFUL018036 [Ladona fulva]
MVVGFLECKVLCREIARRMGVAATTISRLETKWETEHTVAREDIQGRPRSTTADQDDRLLEFVRENPFCSSNEARMECNFPVTRRTARRRICAAGLQSRRAAIKEVLTESHRAACLAFAQTYLRKEDFWRKVIFSDEKTFSSTSSRPVRVYRPPNTRFDRRCIYDRPMSG